MLRKKDVLWVKRNSMLRAQRPRKALSNTERQHYFRVRQKIQDTLGGLTSILENMPEQQLEQAFNKDTVGPLLKMLFSLESDDLEARRKRVGHLWNWLLRQFSTHAYVGQLIGKDLRKVLTSKAPWAIEAIFIGTELLEE